MSNKKVVLIILDGWGIAPVWAGNAVGLADTPAMDKITEKFPSTTLEASGAAVGLPFNEPGNSEVGHLNIGAGRIAKQGLTAINQMIDDKSFFENDILRNSIENSIKDNKKLHFVGLVSDGGIHSHVRHLNALLEYAKKCNASQVYVHAILDGRDCPPTSGIEFIDKLEEKMSELNLGKLASVSGRFYAMDRDKHWDRVQKAYDVMVSGTGIESANARNALTRSYADGVTDEFLIPAVIDKKGLISEGDSVIFFNYRSDRARQLIDAIGNKNFSGFKRTNIAKNLNIVSFSSYVEGVDLKMPFESREVAGPLASVFADKKLNHLHVAETEKYAHVTYFFNGGREVPFENETRILVPSPGVKTYDLAPEMSAAEITAKVLPTIGKYEFTVINFANADMVGHSGNLNAAIKAVSFVDKCLGKVIDKILQKDLICLITADHGNAEQMINPLSGLEDTEHTTNPVPFAIVGNHVEKYRKLKTDGKLCDLAPTVLKIMSIEKPKDMIGQVLFEVE